MMKIITALMEAMESMKVKESSQKLRSFSAC
jgi:hypothetical protein